MNLFKLDAATICSEMSGSCPESPDMKLPN